MELKKVQRQKTKLRIGLSGASGFGKTYSSLLLARGMASSWDKIAIIDTESKSASLYANLGEFNTLDLQAPFHPDRYIEAINACENAGMEIIIIDSITHEWSGKGGCLDLHDLAKKSMARENDYTAWNKITPLHRKFIDTILQSSCHVITTVRRKQDYDMVKEEGKTKVIKVGTKEETREGFEYELTINLELINDKHYAKASKDRTSLFMDREPFIVNEELGRELIAWHLDAKEEDIELTTEDSMKISIREIIDLPKLSAFYKSLSDEDKIKYESEIKAQKEFIKQSI